MVARHGQVVVLTMAFLQLHARNCWPPPPRAAPSRGPDRPGWLGYAAGYVWEPWRLEVVWLVPVGAVLNAVGFAFLAVELVGRRRYAWAR